MGLFLLRHDTVIFAAIFFANYILTVGVSPATAQSEALVQSINCGGANYTDANNTGIVWEGDPLNANGTELKLFGKVGKVQDTPGFQNITNVLKTLRSFPESQVNKKFCYKLSIFDGNTYLLRASFLYGNYDGLNNPPSFVLIFNYDVWENVSTTSSAIPTVHELIFTSMGHNYVVCLAPRPDSNHTPFISTLELRLLHPKMYQGNATSAFSLGYGLILWHRINYGATDGAAIRYPDDPYDRIWEANTTGAVEGTRKGSVNHVSAPTTYYERDQEEPPQKVMATAIATPHDSTKSNLSFSFEGFGGTGGFRVEMHCQEVVDEAFARRLGLAFPHSDLRNPSDTGPLTVDFNVPSAAAGPFRIKLDQELQLPLPLEILLFPQKADSPRGPLLNAIELFRWTPLPLNSSTGTYQTDVDAIILVQRSFELIGYGQGDPCIPKDYAWYWITCSEDLPPRIIEINLPNFNLKGDIPPSINNLTYLQKIDLSNNTLGGDIPDLTQLQNLKYLDLHQNNLTGLLPKSLSLLSSLNYLNVDHNDLCRSTSSFENVENFTFIGNNTFCNNPKCNCSSKESSSSSMIITKTPSNKKFVYAISFLGAIYIVSMLTTFLVYMAKRKQRNDKKSTLHSSKYKNDEKKLQGLAFTGKIFSYNEICNATLDFATLLGEGGFGKVYRGQLPNGQLPSGEAIAVKMLEEASKQGVKEFSTEVSILSNVRHKNLVSLIGYCMENSYMLIYEYVAKGNLRDLIYGEIESTDKPLPWTTRLQIALDASQGLEYLHTGCDPSIIHRDVKSSNILLSEKMQAKVSDFGLSRLKEGGSTVSHVSTVNVVGTAGYLDPAYNATNQLTDKSDVYSFGVVLLELICGRAPIDMFCSPPHIVDWVTPAIVHDRLEDIVDRMLVNGYKVESMWKVIDLAFGCVEHDRLQRPKMTQVSRVLREALEIETTDPKRPPPSQDPSEDVSGGSTKSVGNLPILHYIESLRTRLEPR